MALPTELKVANGDGGLDSKFRRSSPNWAEPCYWGVTEGERRWCEALGQQWRGVYSSMSQGLGFRQGRAWLAISRPRQWLWRSGGSVWGQGWRPRHGGAPRRGPGRRGDGWRPCPSCRTACGKWSRRVVGPRRVLAGRRWPAVKNDDDGEL